MYNRSLYLRISNAAALIKIVLPLCAHSCAALAYIYGHGANTVSTNLSSAVSLSESFDPHKYHFCAIGTSLSGCYFGRMCRTLFLNISRFVAQVLFCIQYLTICAALTLLLCMHSLDYVASPAYVLRFFIFALPCSNICLPSLGSHVSFGSSITSDRCWRCAIHLKFDSLNIYSGGYFCREHHQTATVQHSRTATERERTDDECDF